MEYNPVDIFTQRDLQKQVVGNSINVDIIIRGEHLKTLNNIFIINGFLGISDSSLETLGDLKEITGDFWTSFHTVFSPLNTLGNIEKIGGDATFRYSNLSDLGALKYVGGKLSLRDTPIDNLGGLEFVGGDLFLPKRLKDKVDLSRIHVKGKVQFWNDTKSRKEILDKAKLDLKKSSYMVPFWVHQYVYSIDALKGASDLQKEFYARFKEHFKNNVFIDIEGNDNYSFVLFYDLINDYTEHKDIVLLQHHFDNLEKYYPKTRNYTSLSIIDEFEKLSDFESAWSFQQRRDYISVQTVWKYEQRINRRLLDGDIMVRLVGCYHLTDFGQKNVESIKPYAERYLLTYEEERKSNFFELFFDMNRHHKGAACNNYSAEYYYKFYSSQAEFYHTKANDINCLGELSEAPFTTVIEMAILNQIRVILKKAEDLYRVDIGMPKIGEGWISETELFYRIKDAFKGYEVIHHGNPVWLGRQHLDIYFPELNIGIEYQGLQHYEPVEYFGGTQAFEKNLERDAKKRELCEENNCSLLFVNEKYDFEVVALEIQKMIENILRTDSHSIQ